MKTLLFICFAVLGLSFFFFKKKNKDNHQAQKKSSCSDSSLSSKETVFQSADKTVKIILTTYKNKETKEVRSQAQIHIQNKPISIAGAPILFEINQTSGKVPTQKDILKKIYLISTSSDFLQPPVSSSRLKGRLLRRIYTIRSKNIRHKIVNALQIFNPMLFRKFKQLQDKELKMAEVLLSYAHNAEETLQQQKQKHRKKTAYDNIKDIETDISNESMVNILPENELKSRRIFDQDGRS